MRRGILLLALTLAVTTLPSHAQRPSGAADTASPRRTIRFDEGWRFHRGGAQRAEQPDFDDAAWRAVNLPHDWSIENLPGRDTPFDPDAIGQVNTGFTVGGTGWYRKRFTLPDAAAGRRVLIQFDGVYMNAEIWMNGQPLGSHPYGYTSFWFDVTGTVRPGSNVLAVKVRNEGENSRWYSGSGIYRHVWLTIVDPVHVAQWGTSLTTSGVSAASAQVTARTRVQNESAEPATVTLVTRLTGPAGNDAGVRTDEQTIAAHAALEFDQAFTVAQPSLWSLDTPSLYRAVTEVRVGSATRDRVETPFGIRSVTIDIRDGFRLNGVPMKLQGGCVHHDNGPLGARAYDRAEERRVELLKASGFNAIRCAHNPPSPAFLDACDRLGVLVIDEAFDMWGDPKNPHDYSLFFDAQWRNDLDAMIARDRNHPSIVIWSIGNEIPRMDDAATVKDAQALAAFVREADPSRPVLAAVNDLNPKKDPFFAALDLAGYNYGTAGFKAPGPSIFDTDHARVPSRVMVQTESYALDAFQSWMDVRDRPWLIGDFVWTAFDYLGESSIGWRGYWQEAGFYPWTVAFTGDIDITGEKRPQSFYRDVLWHDNRISVFVTPPEPSFPLNPRREAWSRWHWHDAVADWTWPGREGQPLAVSVYSSYAEAELFLNGRSLGRKPTTRATAFMATWQVPYARGELKAVGYRPGVASGQAVLRSAGPVTQIVAAPDRATIAADGQDLSYVSIQLQDAAGVRHPKADTALRASIDGPGTIVALASANPMSVESFQGPARKAWDGRALVVVQSATEPGDIHVRITAAGLPAATATIRARRAADGQR